MKHIFFHILLFLLILSSKPALSQRLMPDPSSGKVEVVCGMKDDGDMNMCNLKDNKCYKCHEWECNMWTLCIQQKHKEVFYCSSSKPSGDCSHAKDGGISGDTYNGYLGLIEGSHRRGKQCIASNFFIKYSTCYGCIIIKTLISAFITAASHAYDISRQAANAVALVCMMIWLAFFVFKNVTAFTSVEPMKLLQEFFVQCFKVVLALVIINSGMSTILHYTLVPILEMGIDVADSVSALGNNIVQTYINGGSGG